MFLNGLDGRRKGDVAQAVAAVEPTLAHVVEAYRPEVLEVAERAKVILLCSKAAVEPGEAGPGDTHQVDILFPVAWVVACGCHVVVGHRLQGSENTLVSLVYDAGAEAILVGCPCGVGLEEGNLLRQHLDNGVRSVEHALADLHLLGRDGVDMVVAVGDEVEHVDVGKVRTVGEARVFERHVESGVACSVGALAVEVGEVHHTQVLVSLEGACLHCVELEVIPFADVVAELQCALVLAQQILIFLDRCADDDGMFNLVAAHLVHLLHGAVLVGVGILCAVLIVVARGLGIVVDEELLQGLP